MNVDGMHRFALVALDPERPQEIIAVVSFDREGDTDRAEYAAAVEDRWEGVGIALTRRLIEGALKRGTSEYGNTEKVARAVAEALGQHGEARVMSVDSVDRVDPQGMHVLVVGVPTQRHGVPEAVKELLERTPRGALRGVRALAFDTRYRRARWITGSAVREIGKHLRRMGCKTSPSRRASSWWEQEGRWNR